MLDGTADVGLIMEEIFFFSLEKESLFYLMVTNPPARESYMHTSGLSSAQ